MIEQTQTQETSLVTANSATVRDFKYAVLIVSIVFNVAIFTSWVLAHAAAGTI